MGKNKQKAASGATVRIWREPKERLLEVVKEKARQERRLVSEAELVSKAVDLYCDEEEPKLGIK